MTLSLTDFYTSEKHLHRALQEISDPCNQNDEEIWPEQQKDKDKDNNKEKDS